MKLAIVIFVVWWALVVCIAMRLQTMRRGTARVEDLPEEWKDVT